MVSVVEYVVVIPPLGVGLGAIVVVFEGGRGTGDTDVPLGPPGLPL